MTCHLYIHFPFCLYKCLYCDFNSYATKFKDIPFAAYREALLEELRRRADFFEHEGKHSYASGSRLTTIFFGGGTPSLMPAGEMEKILKGLSRFFHWDDLTEITVEANPKTITPQHLRDLKNLGINRASLGVQSLHDEFLASFGRIHTADDAREAVQWIGDVGFHSWNMDMICGFPGQGMKTWQRDLREAVSYEPPHLSCYAFTVEEEAPYGRMARQGKALVPEAQTQAAMFEWTRGFLQAQGYGAYEISNFCRPGHESRHNLNYWNYGSYVGIGAGAVSSLHQGRPFSLRTINRKLPQKYMKEVAGQTPWFDVEEIPRQTAMGEYMMMGLRLSRGVDTDRFRQLFGMAIEEAFPQALRAHRNRGLIREDQVALTPQGFLFSNQVMQDFV